MAGPHVRLYVEQPLAAGQAVAMVEGQANYLFAVMRLGPGAEVYLFNGADGEWRAEVAEANKRRGILICREQVAPQVMPPDLWLVFAPVRKERMAFVVEKAVELGVARLVPVQTRRTQGERIRPEKMAAHAAEAAEQCGTTFVPPIDEVQPLERLLAAWPKGRRLYWADEARAGESGGWSGTRGEAAAILIGPEGGFTPEEQALLAAHPSVHPVALGPRILRAETAAFAAITLWQAQSGDWA